MQVAVVAVAGSSQYRYADERCVSLCRWQTELLARVVPGALTRLHHILSHEQVRPGHG